MFEWTYFHWLSLGLILLILESLGAAGLLIALSMAAFETAFFVWLLGISFQLQWLFFGLFAVGMTLFWWFLLRPVYRRQADDTNAMNRKTEGLIGRTFFLASPLHNGEGHVHIDGVYWRIKGIDLPIGAEVIVVDIMDGALIVKVIDVSNEST